MRPSLFSLFAALALTTSARAFTLLGPLTAWQNATIGYNIGNLDNGGPMALGQGYRWNMPVVTYALDATFLNYYGEQGAQAVDAAFKIMNALPSADAMTTNLVEFPQNALRVNSTANALGIWDIKTTVLAILMEQMGLGAPERYVWTLRSRVVPVAEPIANYFTINRNYDPITLEQSAYVNGTLFTFAIQHTYANPDTWEAVDLYSDPLPRNPRSLTLSGYFGILNGTVDFGIPQAALGGFYNGLSRDDAGGLRYLLSSKRTAVESYGADVVVGNPYSGVPTVGSGSGSGSGAWTPAISVTAITGAVTTAGNAIVQATLPQLRPGVGKIQFTKVEFDSLTSTTLTPYVVQWTDRYVTNGTIKSQVVSRLVNAPDIIFGAGDLGTATSGNPIALRRFVNFQNLAGINTAGGGGELDGPGVCRPQVSLSFSNVGRYYAQVGAAGTLNEGNAFVGVSFGSFDGTTNAPIVFPTGFSLKELEALVFQGK